MMVTATESSELRQKIDAEFPFEIYKGRMTGPDNLATPHFGLFRDDRTEDACVGNAVRANYVPHTRDDVAAMSEAVVDAMGGVDYKIACHWNHGHNVTIGPTKEYRASVINDRDSIWPRFVLNAGYGGRAFSASLGLYRDVCSNLQMVRSAGQSISASIRHTSGLRPRIADLIEQFQGLLAEWQGVVTTAQEMQSRTLAVDEYLAEVFPKIGSDNKRESDNARRRIRSVVMRVSRERQRLGLAMGDLGQATAWELYNGVQGYAQHEMPRRGNPSQYERALKSLDESIVAKAMELSLAS
ncbi:MAG: DUF932 domain-containing protein [Pseudomonadota bacterium]